jgi:hypothetical protein
MTMRSPRTTRAGIGVRWTVAWAVAATVLAMALAMRQVPPPVGELVVPTNAWGWVRPGAFPSHAPRTEYLNHLADAAEEWFQSRPDRADLLALRIGVFRQGCSLLILSDHPPLDAADREWLNENCRAWSARFDGYLIALEAGGDLFVIGRQADRTVETIEASLRARARSK